MFALSVGASLLWTILVLPVVAFAILFSAYALGIMGGGDVKLLLALMPLIGYPCLSQFALNTIRFGGLVAFAVLMHAKVYDGKCELRENNPPSVPYGVAIAAGASTVGPIWSKFLAYFGMFF